MCRDDILKILISIINYCLEKWFFNLYLYFYLVVFSCFVCKDLDLALHYDLFESFMKFSSTDVHFLLHKIELIFLELIAKLTFELIAKLTFS